MDPLAGASFLTLLSSNPPNAQPAPRHLPRSAVLVGQENTPLAPNHHARHRVFHGDSLTGPEFQGAASRTQFPWPHLPPACCAGRPRRPGRRRC